MGGYLILGPFSWDYGSSTNWSLIFCQKVNFTKCMYMSHICDNCPLRVLKVAVAYSSVTCVQLARSTLQLSAATLTAHTILTTCSWLKMQFQIIMYSNYSARQVIVWCRVRTFVVGYEKRDHIVQNVICCCFSSCHHSKAIRALGFPDSLSLLLHRSNIRS